MIGNVNELMNPLALDALQLGPTGSAAGVAWCGTGTLPLSVERHLHPDDISANYGGLNSIGCLTGVVNTTGILIAPPLKGTFLPSRVLNLPLPLPHSRDTGVALPTAALPYNDMKINFQFRKFSELLIGDVYDNSAPSNIPAFPGWSFYIGTAPDSISFPEAPEVWGTYALVSNAERSRMGCHPRDILIEQQQETTKPLSAGTDAATFGMDIRFSHSIKALFWGFKNTTIVSEHSNWSSSTGVPLPDGMLFNPFYGTDPVGPTKLSYENTDRMDMGTEYYSNITQYFNAPNVSDAVGYHLYSFALDFFCLDPMGSTNFGKLSNVSLNFTLSSDAQLTSAASTTTYNANQVAQTSTPAAGALRTGASSRFIASQWLWGNQMRNSFKAVVIGLNYQIVRISGGTFGFGLL